MSTVTAQNVLGSNIEFDVSTSSKITSKGFSIILEKPLTNNSYGIFGANLSKLNFSIEERYYLKNRESIDGSNGDTPFFNFKFGLGNKIKLRPNTYLFIETTAETVRGKWFGVDHSIEEFSTAMGLGISF